MNRKGQGFVIGLILIVLIIVVVYGLIIVASIGKNITSDFNSFVQADSNYAEKSKEISSQNDNRFNRFWDSAIVVVFFFLWLASLYAALKANEEPVMFAAFIVVWVVVLVISFGLQADYDDFISDEEYQDVPTDFPMTHFIMNHFIIVFLFVMVSTGTLFVSNTQGLI